MEGRKYESNKQRINEALKSARAAGLQVHGMVPPRDVAAALDGWCRSKGMVPDDPAMPLLYATPGVAASWQDFEGVKLLVSGQPQLAEVRPFEEDRKIKTMQQELGVSYSLFDIEPDITPRFHGEELREAVGEAQAEGLDVVGAICELGEVDRQEAHRMRWINQEMFGGKGWLRPRWMDGRNTTREWREFLGIKLLVTHARVSHTVGEVEEAPRRFELRPYQQQAVERLEALWAAGYHALLLQSVTGSGKTEMFIAAAMAWLEKGGYVVVLAPKQELVRQTARRCARAIVSMGGDPDTVGMMMQGEEPLPGQRVIVSTFDSAHKLEERGDLLVIVDEAHRSGGSRVVSALEALAPDRLLGVTATPMRSSGKMLGDIYQFMLSALEYEHGFEQGFLVRPRYLIPSAADVQALRELKRQIKEMQEAAKAAGDITDAAAEAWLMSPGIIGGLVEHINKHASDRSGIVFTPTVKSASAVADELRGAGYVAEMICAKTPKPERKAMLQRFEDGETQWLVNVDVLTEGVDVPSCGAVVIARPTKSPVRWIQMAGRALRPAEGKGDCLILDHTGTLLELGPVESYTSADWELEEGGEAKFRPQDGKEVSLNEIDRECGGCGHHWHGASPACPVCGAVVTTRGFAQQNLAALQAELQEYRPGMDINKLAATYRGQQIGAQDIIGILHNESLDGEGVRAQVLKKVVPAEMREALYRMLIHWAAGKNRARPDHTAFMIYKSFFGTGTDPRWGREPLPYSQELRPVVMEMVRMNAAAYWEKKNAGKAA